MQTNPTRTVAAAVAVLAAAAVGYTLHPSAQQTALAARNPAVEVRTEVIRRTIHIVRHERARPPLLPPGSTPVAAGQAAAGQGTAQPAGQRLTAVRTSTSKHPATSSPATTSGAPGAVTTRTSRGVTAAGGSGKPVTTRTSAAGHGDDGGGDGRDD